MKEHIKKLFTEGARLAGLFITEETRQKTIQEIEVILTDFSFSAGSLKGEHEIVFIQDTKPEEDKFAVILKVEIEGEKMFVNEIELYKAENERPETKAFEMVNGKDFKNEFSKN